MKYTAKLALGLAAVAGAAQAQLALPSSILGLTISPPCQGAIINVLTNSSFAQCFPIVQNLIPPLTQNTSLVPALDNFMSEICFGAAPVCSNATLATATQTILAGCAADLATDKLPNSTVSTAFGLYPFVREVLCLKTKGYYTAQSYGGFLGAPALPQTDPPFNISSANGEFCVTSVLQQFSAYLGANITLPYIEAAATGANTTALGLLGSVNLNVLCNPCVFALYDILELILPIAGTVDLTTVFGTLGLPVPAGYGNVTVNELLDGECAYSGLAVNTNKTSPLQLPVNITETIVNSTFPFAVSPSSTMP